MAFTGYRIYRGAGGIGKVDFATPVESVSGAASGVQLAGKGHEPSTKYTYVVRPVLADLESPDVSCAAQFETDPAGDWLGSRPAPVEIVETEVLEAGKVRLRWSHRTRPGWPEPDDFGVYHAQTPAITPGSPQATVAYSGDGQYTATLSLTGGKTYWFAVTARTESGAESVLSEVVGPFVADAAAPPQPTVYTGATFR